MKTVTRSILDRCPCGAAFPADAEGRQVHLDAHMQAGDAHALAAQIRATLPTFLAYCQALVDAYRDKHFPTLPRTILTIDPEGKRYARIVKNDGGDARSVYCFVDLTNGDILKADGWKRPAKHARGRLLDRETYAAAVTQYGGAYLR